MFGVWIGHGVNEHLVSDFVMKSLPRILSTAINGVVDPPLLTIKTKKQRDSSMIKEKKKKLAVQDSFLPQPRVKGGVKLTSDAIDDSSLAEDEQPLKRVVVQEECEVNQLSCHLKMFLKLKNGREIKPSAIFSEVKGTRETLR